MAVRTMSKTLFSFIATIGVLAAQNCLGAEPDRPALTAALEKNAAIGPTTSATSAGAEPPPRAPLAEPSAPRGNPLWAIPLRALAATRERPLFSASRRPPAPPVIPQAPDPTSPMPVAVKAAEPERPPLVLVGTIVGADTRIAVVLNQTTMLVSRVREGDEESGWRVRTVLLRSTVMEKDDQSVTLDLPGPENERAATGSVPEAPPAQMRENAR
jgi:general secretion pathway protein N